MSKSNTWLTPPAIINSLGGAQSFDLDPCASLNRPWDTAQNHFTIEDNGLLQNWFGRVWLNPPYSSTQIVKWLGRMEEHGTGTALIFARTETVAFSKYVFGSADSLLFIEGRLNFHYPNGLRANKNAGAPSVLCAYGSNDTEMLSASDIPGTFVPLTLSGLIQVANPLGTWAQELRSYMSDIDGPITLSDLYRAFSTHRKCIGKKHYKEKIRQQLQSGPYKRLSAGVWQLELG